MPHLFALKRAMSAIEHWRNRVETHHNQSIGVQERYEGSDDFWRPFAPAFRADPRRTDDEVLKRLVSRVRSDGTLLDVGGGAGRFALALALHCRHVTVVEPSESMLQELRETAQQTGVENLGIEEASWEDAEVDAADVVLCSHVVYGVADIAPFVRKLQAHARDLVLMPMFIGSPQAGISPFWRHVHGEDRVDLPALPEFLQVLWELEIYPDLEMVETTPGQTFESKEKAIEQLRQRLYVVGGTEEERALKTAAADLLVDTADGVAVRGTKPRRLAIISWRPE